MDSIFNSIQQYIKDGEYFLDARKWYNVQYVYPIVHRSFLLLFCLIFLILCTGIIINLHSLLPITQQVRYVIKSNSLNSNATIMNVDHISNDSLSVIVDIMVKNYLICRESYDYELLTNQFIFIQNNSTRLIFKQFANFMNIDNALSPVIRYQKSFKRAINIISIIYSQDNNEAIIKFEALAKNNTNDILENMIWQATINFEIDPINLYLPDNSRFNFVVTNYKLKLLEDKK